LSDNRVFLLKFPRDRRRWIDWLYQAKKRYHGLSVLNCEPIVARERLESRAFMIFLGIIGFLNFLFTTFYTAPVKFMLSWQGNAIKIGCFDLR
jgi:hypothetical protein